MQTINVNEPFAQLIAKWHVQCLMQLQHMIDTPDDVSIQIVDEDTGVTKTLDHAEQEIFIQAILVAKTIFAELPFKMTSLSVVNDAEAETEVQQ